MSRKQPTPSSTQKTDMPEQTNQNPQGQQPDAGATQQGGEGTEKQSLELITSQTSEGTNAVVANDPESEVKDSGTTTVDNQSDETLKAAESAEVVEDPKIDVTAEAMAQQQHDNAMAVYIDRIKKDGTYGEQLVVDTMESYLKVMASGGPLETSAIVREQTRLYSMFKNIGRRGDDFRKAIVAARFFFRAHKDGAFHDTRINRGHEALQLSADDRRAFYTYLQLFKIIASVNDLKDVKKSVDVSRSLTNPAIPAEVKDRYVSLVS